MSITVTPVPEPVGTSPKVTGQVSVSVGAVMSSLEVYRTDPNGRALIRKQPAPGFDLASFEDFDCPFGVEVFYDWNAVYTDSSAYTTLFNETWASLSSWTNDGTWNVSSGKARSGAQTTSGNKLYRSVTQGKYRVTIASFALATAVTSTFRISFRKSSLVGGDYVNLYWLTYSTATQSGNLKLQVSVGGVVTEKTIVASGTAPIVVDFLPGSVSVVNGAATASVAVDTQFSYIVLETVSQSTSNTMLVGAVKVENYGAPATISESSATIVLDPPDDWIVQPAQPSKSVRLANTPAGRRLTGVRGIGDIENDSNETLHYIMGSTLPVSTSTGERYEDVTSMQLWVPDAAAEDALMAPLRDGIPLLFQFNPLRTDHRFKSGFYSVGKIRRVRRDPNLYRGVQSRLFELPLTKAMSPVVQVSSPAFTLAELDLAFSSLADVDARYASLEDLRVDNRS